MRFAFFFLMSFDGVVTPFLFRTGWYVLKWLCTCLSNVNWEGNRIPQCSKMHLNGLLPLCAATWRSSQALELDALLYTLQPSHRHTYCFWVWVSTWCSLIWSVSAVGSTVAPHFCHRHSLLSSLFFKLWVSELCELCEHCESSRERPLLSLVLLLWLHPATTAGGGRIGSGAEAAGESGTRGVGGDTTPLTQDWGVQEREESGEIGKVKLTQPLTARGVALEPCWCWQWWPLTVGLYWEVGDIRWLLLPE